MMERRRFLGGSMLLSLGFAYFPVQSMSRVVGNAIGANILDHRLIAQDVCAWPKLALSPANEVLALIHNQPVHGSLGNSDVELWRGTEEGRKWSRQSIVTHSTADTSYYNHAIGLNRLGEIVILTSGWTKNKMNKQNLYDKGRDAYLINPVSGISRDGGKTWKLGEQVESNEEGINVIPFGTITLAEDGSLRVAAFVFRPKDSGRIDTCYVLKSSDNGVSWFIDAIIGNYMQNETDLAYAGGNTWYALCRKLNEGGHNIELFRSGGDGRNWESLGMVTKANQHPGDILPCKDGKLIITYGNRIPGQCGVEAMISYDKGVSWSDPVRLANTNNRDSGYPSSVQLSDGTIVTGYYANGGDLYEKYYFGIVKWNLRK